MTKENLEGLCQCGCGQKTTIAKVNNKKWGYVKSKPVRFINHHHNKGPNNSQWKGGCMVDGQGYIKILAPGHPRANQKGYVPEAVLVAERATGKCLPFGAIVHHANEIKSDNRPKNLVVCENETYHHFLHERMIAIKATGDPHKRKCTLCKRWDEIKNIKRATASWVHPEYDKAYHKEYYIKHRDKFLRRAQEQHERRSHDRMEAGR